MSTITPPREFETQLAGIGITAAPAVNTCTPAYCYDVRSEEWQRATHSAVNCSCRFVGSWIDDRIDALIAFALFELHGTYLMLRTTMAPETPRLASQAPLFPGAIRMEQHSRDMFGIEFIDHPDPRRWTRHQAWPENAFPLRHTFPAAGFSPKRTPADRDYPFTPVQGVGVYEIPVGPVHAGIIEPGHFRFQAVGEEVLSLEERLGYVHKGIEKIAVGRDLTGLARLAGRVSGDSTVAHTWAGCQAIERALHCDVPSRAQYLRALMAERERVANHLGDIGAICNDVAFTFAYYQCSRLREIWTRRSGALFGHRFMMDCVVPGGVAVDINPADMALLRQDHKDMRHELDRLFDILNDQPSLEDRLFGTGQLSPEAALRLGVTGYVGKASGIDYDARRDSRYAPYDTLDIEIPVFHDGDVAARMRVRMEEIIISLRLMDRLLDTLPDGPRQVACTPRGDSAEGLGIVEGWRGEIVTYVRLDTDGRVARFFPRDPSWFTWPALEQLIHGNIVPDFPVCNKSVNGSYSAHDL